MIAVADVIKEDSPRAVKELQNMGIRVVMLTGDNERTAKAIGAGTDIAIDAADVVLMKSRLSDVPAAIRLSRATLRNIHENLFWAFFLQCDRNPVSSRNLVSAVWTEVKSDVRRGGYEPFQLLCGNQCPASEPVQDV